MIRQILLASTCSASLIFGAAVVGAAPSQDDVEAGWTVAQAPLQLAENDQDDASTTGTAGEAAATGTTGEQADDATATESAAGATEQEDSGNVTGGGSAVGNAAGAGTGGAHCEQSRVATGQPSESASDNTC